MTVFVIAHEGEPFESLFRRFTRGVQDGGIIREYRRHLRFRPAHERRREKLLRARRSARRAA